MKKKVIAIIGSRELTGEQKAYIKEVIAEQLDPAEWQIVSGCAFGADELALQFGHDLGFETIGIVPWSKYNLEIQQKHCDKIVCLDDLTLNFKMSAYESVEQHHPAPKRLSAGARRLHARNYGIIRWADRVLAAPGNKPGGGGTGQGLRIAKAMDKPIEVITHDGFVERGWQ